jgi:hypothetical protein
MKNCGKNILQKLKIVWKCVTMNSLLEGKKEKKKPLKKLAYFFFKI